MAAHKQQAGKKRSVKYGGTNDPDPVVGDGTVTGDGTGNPTAAAAATGNPTGDGTVPEAAATVPADANDKTCVQKLDKTPTDNGKYVQVLGKTHIFFNINGTAITDMEGSVFVPDGTATFYQVVPSATGGKRKSAKKPRKHAKKARKSAKKARKSRGSRKSRK